MAKAEAKTAVMADGLRYKSKASGSPFAAAASFGGATMSCFMCGKHRARSLMGTRKSRVSRKLFVRLPAKRWTRRQMRQRLRRLRPLLNVHRALRQKGARRHSCNR